MSIIGIDPGTASTGYGIIRENKGGNLEVVDYGVIRTASGKRMSERLSSLYNQLQEILNLHSPQSSAVEKLFFQRNVKTAISVGQARGVAILALAQSNLGVAEYTPLEVKQAVVGYGGADKNQVKQMVRVLLNLSEVPSPDDAADALAVAICHLHSQQTRLNYSNDSQQEQIIQ